MTDMGAPRRSEQLSIFEWSPPCSAPREDVVPMPTTRAECLGEGACVKLSCRWNITLEVSDRGNLRLNAPISSSGQRAMLLLRTRDRPATRADIEAFEEAVIARLADGTPNCALDLIDASPDGMTLEEVGDALGTSREYVRQVEDRALASLTPRQRRQLARALTGDDQG